MFDIKIVAVGKIKEPTLESLTGDLLKKLRPYARLEFVEVKAEAFRRGSDKIAVKKKESDKILKIMEKHKDVFTVVLDERGREFTSHEFADFLKNKENKQLLFIIGGALGLNEEVLKKADIKMSLSKMTFLHEMVRVVILEQIYRSIAILRKKDYHY